MSGPVDVQAVDPRDEPALRAVWEVARSAHDLRPFNTYWAWEPFRATQQTQRTDLETVLLLARDAQGRAVGMVEAQHYLLANRHLTGADLMVRPDARRRGVGTALLRELERRVVAAGRSTLLVEVFVTPGEDAPGRVFAERHGFEVAMEEGFKACDLAATEHLWDGLAAGAAPHHEGYRVVRWEGRVPDELAAAYCAMQSVFLSEAPTGDMDIEPEPWDEQRLRQRDDRMVASGRRQVGAVALAPDGSPAGLSELTVSDADPEHAMQGITLVLGDHRGHRLGLALKIEVQRALRAAEPRCHHVFTDNADENVHMNAVNELLGFRTVEHLLEVQKTFDGSSPRE